MTNGQPDNSDSSGPTSNCNQNGDSEPCPKAPVIVKVTQNVTNGPAHQHSAKYDKHDWYDKARVAILGLTFVAAALAAYFTWRIAYSDDIKDQSRAYVFAEPANIYNVHKQGSPMQAYTRIGNSGQTLAQDVERWVRVVVADPEGPNRFDDLGPADREIGIIAINPRGQHSVIRERANTPNLTGPEIGGIISGKQRIYVFGTIKYKDVFGRRHYTNFCHIYFGHEVAPSGNGYLGTQARYCDKHNNAD